MPKKRRSRAFWKNFKFKYKLTVVNENTLEEIVGLRVSKLNGLSVLLSVLAVLFLIAACIIAFTPLRNYLPGYMNSEVRSQIVDNALRVDSLQELLDRQNLYIMNIQDIFSGKVPIDSVQTLDSLTVAREDTLMERTRREEEFRRQYEENEKYNLTTIVSQPDVNGLILYRPTRGMVSDHFQYDDMVLSSNVLKKGENLIISVIVTNEGDYDGCEVVQLYLHDIYADVVRPVKELKNFKRIFLKKGESREVRFVITEEDLKFYNSNLQYVYELGDFEVMVRTNSRNVQSKTFFAE